MRQSSALFWMLFLAHSLGAQSFSEPTILPETAAREQLATQPESAFQPIAQTAHVQGDVVVFVLVDENGRIVSAHALSGPAMLQQAAINAVKKFQFIPFPTDNKPIRLAATLTIPFRTGTPGEGTSAEREGAAQAWYPLWDKCRNALRAQDGQESLDYCKQAVDMSLKAGDLTSSDQLKMVLSHLAYSHALARTRARHNEAPEQITHALQEASKCIKDSDQEKVMPYLCQAYGTPYFWRAIEYVSMGRDEDALPDLKIAEETRRRAIARLPDMKENHSESLAVVLRYHAMLLEMMGRSNEAAKLRAEADSPQCSYDGH